MSAIAVNTLFQRLPRRTRKLEAHALKFANRLAKLLTVVRIADCLVERALGEADHLSGDADSSLVEDLDGNL